MKSLLFPLCSVLALGLSLSSCKKDKDEDPKPTPVAPTKTNTEKLTGKNWNIRALTVSPARDFGNGTPITDVYAHLPSTDRDDFERYDKPDVYKLDEGPTKVDAAPQTYPGTWTFSAGEQTINIRRQNGQTKSYAIVELTETTLKTRETEVENGTTYTLERTYAVQ